MTPQVEAALRRHGIDAEVIACDPDFADTAAFCERYGVDPADSANAILLASKRPQGVVAMALVLATTRLDVNVAMCRAMDVRKASFASAEETLERTGMAIGGVTPVGVEGVPIHVDRRVMERASIVIGGGDRSSKLRLRPAELLKLPDVTVSDIAAGG